MHGLWSSPVDMPVETFHKCPFPLILSKCSTKCLCCLRQMTWMTPTWHWPIQSQRSLCVSLVSHCAKFDSASMAMTNRFQVICHFETSAQHDSILTVNTKFSKYTIFVPLVLSGLKCLNLPVDPYLVQSDAPRASMGTTVHTRGRIIMNSVFCICC